MNCKQARQLFDASMDGELSPSLKTELGAHRLKCPECRRALALMEVAGHIVASDRQGSTLSEGFTDRLLACLNVPKASMAGRLRQGLYIAGPLAAAAVIVLAFLGVFDRPQRVAGRVETADHSMAVVGKPSEAGAMREPVSGDAQDARARALSEWIREGIETKQESSKSLRNGIDLTISQLLDLLESSKENGPGDKDVDDNSGDSLPAMLMDPSEEDLEDL